MSIRTTVVCVPIHSPESTLAFYKSALGLSDIQIDGGIITLELPNLSLFLMEKEVFEGHPRSPRGRATGPRR